MIYGTGGRDVLTGTTGADLIFGGTGADTITTGSGNDIVIYRSFRDAGDTITDFAPGADRLDVAGLLASLGVPGDPSALGTSITFTDVSGGVRVNYVQNGAARSLVTVQGVTAAQMNDASNFIF
jgi:Ca2+-binding RTX toxin-like protein